MRVIFYIFLAIISIFVSSIIIAPSIFDINTYKKKITEIVYKKTGNKLEINGPIKLALFPTAKVYFQNVKLYKENKPTLFESKKIYLYPALFELLKGKITFEKIYVENAFINLIEKKGKKNNWSFEIKENKKASNIKNTKDLNNIKETISVKNNNILNIKKIEIKESYVRFTKIQDTYEIKNINLKLNKRNAAFNIKGSLSYFDEEIGIKYKITPQSKHVYNLDGEIFSKIANVKKNINFNKNKYKLDGDLEVIIYDLNDLLGYKYMTIMPLSLKSKFIYVNEKCKLENIVVRSLDNVINAKGSIANSKIKNINLKVSADKLNFNKYYLSNKKNTEKNVQHTSNSAQKKLVVNNKNQSNFLIRYQEQFNKLNQYRINLNFKVNQFNFKKYNIIDINGSVNKEENINIKINADNFMNGTIKVESNLNKNGKIKIGLISTDTNFDYIPQRHSNELFSGKLGTNNTYILQLKNNNKLLENLNGFSKVNFRDLILKNINLNNLKESILNFKDFNDIKNFSRNTFKGNTDLKDQNFSFTFKEGVVNLPISKLEVDETKLIIKGKYNLINDKLGAQVNFEETEESSILPLFGIRMSGNLSDVKKNIYYDESKVKKILEKKAKKEFEKIIKKNLEKNFDNVLDKLLN